MGGLKKFCDRIKYLITEKSGIPESINHNFGKIRIDSNNFLPIEKILTFHYALIILIKPVDNKKKNNCYYNTFFKKGFYKDKSDTPYFLLNVCML